MRLGAPRGLMMIAAMLGSVGAGLMPRMGIGRTSSDTKAGRQMNSKYYLSLKDRDSYNPPKHQRATCDNGEGAKARRRMQMAKGMLERFG